MTTHASIERPSKQPARHDAQDLERKSDDASQDGQRLLRGHTVGASRWLSGACLALLVVSLAPGSAWGSFRLPGRGKKPNWGKKPATAMFKRLQDRPNDPLLYENVSSVRVIQTIHSHMVKYAGPNVIRKEGTFRLPVRQIVGIDGRTLASMEQAIVSPTLYASLAYMVSQGTSAIPVSVNHATGSGNAHGAIVSPLAMGFPITHIELKRAFTKGHNGQTEGAHQGISRWLGSIAPSSGAQVGACPTCNHTALDDPHHGEGDHHGGHHHDAHGSSANLPLERAKNWWRDPKADQDLMSPDQLIDGLLEVGNGGS